jgi:dimethylhistidine N-methyltransferase
VLKLVDEFARDVHEGLKARQKVLPAKYLYDQVGSALFEVITLLPEYGLTRAEERLLRSHAEKVSEVVGTIDKVVELGSGSGRKTQWVLEAIVERQGCVDYVAIDVSDSALRNCRDLLKKSDGVNVRTVQSSYLEGLARVQKERTSAQPLLVLFLGSSIGNFSGGEIRRFLQRMRDTLRAGDVFLLGTDLVKPVRQLLNAYDDGAGVTSAFNKNVLSRINRELDGNFDLKAFDHEARWNSSASRMEMHLVSNARQIVRVEGAQCTATFERGETIWTESSQKFSLGDLFDIAVGTGFEPTHQWIDQEWPFAENLWVAR